MELASITAGIAGGKGQNSTYLASRGIGLQTVLALGIRSGMDYYPQLEQESKGIRFPYRNGYKARAFPNKAFVSSKDFKTSFWNEERVLRAGLETVYLTEGELDAISLVEAGISPEQVLSVPNGAREEPSPDPFNAKCYSYVKHALMNGLGRVKTFIWCGDADQPGIALRSDMAAIVGEARFRFIKWPDGVKDANEMLVKQGAKDLHQLVTRHSLEWPVDGIYKLSDIPEPPALVLWDAGFNWGRRIKLAQRTLCVFTGKPASGKSTLAAQMFYNVVRGHCVPACIATFETKAKPHYRRILRQLYHNKLEQFQTDTEHKVADEWINGWYQFLIHSEERPTLKWLLDKAEVAVVRHGARIIQVDPWNRLEHMRDRNETETAYVGRCLRELHCFAHDLNCHVQVIAHPSKTDASRRDKPSDLEDVSGSMNFFNMPDQGFCIHREKTFDGLERRTDAKLYHLKARFSELGWPCEVKLNYDLSTESYVSLENKY